MPKVKIISSNEYTDGNGYSSTVLGDGICDWEEITDEEVKFLRDNLYKIDFGLGYNMHHPVLIVQDEMKIIERIESLKVLVAEEQENVRRTKAEEAHKKEEKALKRVAKTKLQELALLKTLEEKYRTGDNNNDSNI